ncbi:MAG: transglycosylase SLT domain-containing protein [Acidimicrobiia bacterium]
MLFDGMRFARIGLLAGWILVSMLVVAGFAAFSADDQTDASAVTSILSADVGRTAGAVAALSFVGSAETTSSTAGLALDPTAAGGDAVGLSLRVAPPTEPSDKQGGVYVRSGYLSETEMRALVTEHFEAADVNRAIRVAWCVSAFNPSTINPATGASGLFQHLPENWAEYSTEAGFPEASVFDPEANIAVAAWMLYELPGGWSHWDCLP